MIFLITQSMTRLLFGAPQTAPGQPVEEREPSDFEKWAKRKCRSSRRRRRASRRTIWMVSGCRLT